VQLSKFSVSTVSPLTVKAKSKTIKINKPQDVNVILGQSHFIKTVEDLIEMVYSYFNEDINIYE
jgi:hypothetical protein